MEIVDEVSTNTILSIKNINFQQSNKKKNEEIDLILKRLCYNLFITLYSDVTNDIDIQEYYESFTTDKSQIQNKLEDVIVNETHPYNKELLETYQIQVGLLEDSDETTTTHFIPILYDGPQIMKKIIRILKEKEKMKMNGKINHHKIKDLLNKILVEKEKEGKNKNYSATVPTRRRVKYHEKYYQDMIDQFIKDDDYFDFILSSLFKEGYFCKDIISLNKRKCMILSSRSTFMEICRWLLIVCQQRLEEISQKININIEKKNKKKNENNNNNSDNNSNSNNNNNTNNSNNNKNNYNNYNNIISEFRWQSLNLFFGIQKEHDDTIKKLDTETEEEEEEEDSSSKMKDSAVDITAATMLTNKSSSKKDKKNNTTKQKYINENQYLSIDEITGYNYGKKIMKEKIKELKELIDPEDTQKLNSLLETQFKKCVQIREERISRKRIFVESDEKECETMYQDKEDKLDIENLLNLNSKWNRSTINGSQEKQFLNNSLALSCLMEVLNKFEFNTKYNSNSNNNSNNNNYKKNNEDNIQLIHNKISQIKAAYVCLCIAGIMTITNSLFERSKYQRGNLATKTEVFFVTNLLGVPDVKSFLCDHHHNHSHNKNVSLPIFCQIMNDMVDREKKNEQQMIYNLLGINDKDFKIVITLFMRMNEEYQQYCIVRYPKSDQPHKNKIKDNNTKERTQLWNELIRGLVMAFLLIIFHYVFLSQYQKSPFNIFRK